MQRYPWILLVYLYPALTLALVPPHNRASNNDLPWRLPNTLFSLYSPFVPVDSNDTECREHSRLYLQGLEDFQMWALKMFDANAKLPSGLLNGNVNQLGDFDQCLSVQQPHGDVRGQYCLAYIEISLQPGQPSAISEVHSLLHSHNLFRSKLEDPGHRVPRFSTVNWAVCVPASCSTKDIEHALISRVDHILSDNGLSVRIQVDPAMCQVRSDSILPPPASLLAIGCFLAIFGVIAAATITDYLVSDKTHATTRTEVLLCFSLLRNCRRLFSFSQDPEDIHCVHGIRALNAMMLFMSHKSMALVYTPFMNRTKLAENAGRPWTVLVKAATLYTDPFIMMSGLLTSHSLLRQFTRHRNIDMGREYFSRALRVIPNLAALILFCTFVLPHLGSGPQWNLVVGHHAELCKTSWWRNLLFIHNYFGFKNMCLTHTHHIGTDTQLFALSPLLVWAICKSPRHGLLSILVLAIASTVLRFYATYVHQLSLFCYYGIPVSQVFDSADYSYILPSHRFTVYAMGICLGYGLRFWGQHFKLKSNQLTLGWIVSVGMLYLPIISPSNMVARSYVYDALEAAYYAAFAPIAWCTFFAWIIFTSYTGNGGFLSKLLSWRGFQVFTRISYSFYLTQFPVFFYNVGQLRTAEYYTVSQLINIKELFLITLSSVLLTLTFEMPFINMRSVLIKRRQAITIHKVPEKAKGQHSEVDRRKVA